MPVNHRLDGLVAAAPVQPARAAITWAIRGYVLSRRPLACQARVSEASPNVLGTKPLKWPAPATAVYPEQLRLLGG